MKPVRDIIIIGAGPAGSAAAFHAARNGLNALVIEKSSWPRPKTCAGGISPRGRALLKSLGVWEKFHKAGYPIMGLHLVSPKGKEAMLAGVESATVINRRIFDDLLMQSAMNAGSSFLTDTKVEALLRENNRVTGVVAGGREYYGRWVLSAEGANTRFSPDRNPREILHTAMAWYENASFTPNIIDMIYDNEILPYYMWLFPESEKIVNIGLCIHRSIYKGSVRDLFSRLVERHFSKRLSSSRMIGGIKSHPISVTAGSVNYNSEPGLIVVGEAARLVNPSTGEGISYAMESGIGAIESILSGDRFGWSYEVVSNTYKNRIACFGRNFKAAGFFLDHAGTIINLAASFGSHPLLRRVTSKSLAKI